MNTIRGGESCDDGPCDAIGVKGLSVRVRGNVAGGEAWGGLSGRLGRFGGGKRQQLECILDSILLYYIYKKKKKKKKKKI